MTIPSQHEYEMNEWRMLQKQLQEVERAPLADRKEAQREWLDALRTHPETVAERVGWLLGGNYGYGSYKAAGRIFASPRMNRVAALSTMIAALEWQTPGRMAQNAWKKLTLAERARLKRAIDAELASHARYLKEEGGASRDPRRARSSKISAARRAAISRKVRILRHEGRSPRQAVAIAYRMAGVPARRSRTR